jgi:tetratricopeptide (TPR) repeat protein
MAILPITLLLFLLIAALAVAEEAADFLSLGDNALASDKIQESIVFYNKGIKLLDPQESSLVTSVSLYTNLGTSLSSLGQDADAGEVYRKALKLYREQIETVVDTTMKSDATAIVAQASFFLGMVYQELDENEKAANSYAYANTLDPLHWSALANLGAVLKDFLRLADDALVAYNKAYEILAQTEQEPTDPPAHPEFILAELQHRIGVILMENPARKCAMTDNPDKEVSCVELASHALSLAIQYHPDHEKAKHMLATLTADATMKRASNKYIKSLFDDYAEK